MDLSAFFIGLAGGAMVGFLSGYLLAQGRSNAIRRQLEERAVRAETAVEEVRKQLEDQKRLVAEASEQFKDAIKAYAGDALRESRADLLKAAEENLGKVAEGLKGSVAQVVEAAKGDLGKRQEAIGALVKPVEEALKSVRESSEAMDRRRQEAYGSLEEQLRTLGTMQENLRTEARNLSTALRRPFVRGRWGEVTLRNLVEAAGMSQYCDFEEQVSTNTDEGRLRPDMIIRLPGNRTIVVDSKVPLESYLDAMESPDEQAAKTFMENHAKQVRAHVGQLSSKKYQDQFPHSPDHVIMFIPGESFFSAALEADRELITYAMSRKVALCSPASLFAVFSTVAYMWRQVEMAEGAQKISEATKKLYDRIGLLVQNLDGIRRGLDAAVGAYNKAVGSLEARVLPQARRIKDLGVLGEEIPVLEPVEHSLRELPSGDAAFPASTPDEEADEAAPEVEGP